MQQMTDKQAHVYYFMLAYQEKYSEPASMEKIALEFGWKSRESAFKHVRCLHKKGKVKQLPSRKHFAIKDKSS